MNGLVKRRIAIWLPWLAALVLLLWVVRAVPLTAVAGTLHQLQGWQLGTWLGLNALVLVCLTGRWWLLLAGMGHRLPFFMSMGHRLAAFSAAYFTPGPQFGGEPVQVLLVERRHGVPRTTAVSAVSLDKALELLVNFTFLAGGVWVLLATGLLGGGIGAKAAGATAVLLLLPLLYLGAIWQGQQPLSRLLHVPAPLFARRPAWAEAWATAVHGLRLSEQQAHIVCRHMPQLVVQALCLSLAGWLFMMAEYGLMLTFLGADVTPLQLIAALTAARLAFLLPLPGGVGILEASQVIALGMMGFHPAVGVSAGLLIRARDVALAAAGVWWGSRFARAG